MIRLFKTTLFALLFAIAIAGVSSGTAEAMYPGYYDSYYYEDYYRSDYYKPRVSGYDPYAYSYGYRYNHRDDYYYKPRVSGYDPYVWDDLNYNNYRSRDYRGDYRDYRVRNERRYSYEYYRY